MRHNATAMMIAAIMPAWLLVAGMAPAQVPEPPRAPNAAPAAPAAPSADERLATNLAIVFDGSGSMAGEKIETAKKSLAQFLASVPPDWNVGLIVFDNSGVRTALPIGQHGASVVNEAVASIRAGGGTPLGKTIESAHQMLAEQRTKQQGYGRYLALVVTDGEATDKDAMARTAPAVPRDGMELSVIGFRLPGAHSLRAVATDYRDAGNAQQLTKALAEAVAETNSAEPSFKFERLAITDKDLAPPKAFVEAKK